MYAKHVMVPETSDSSVYVMMSIHYGHGHLEEFHGKTHSICLSILFTNIKKDSYSASEI